MSKRAKSAPTLIPAMLIEVSVGGSRWVDELPPDILVEWVEKEKLHTPPKRRRVQTVASHPYVMGQSDLLDICMWVTDPTLDDSQPGKFCFKPQADPTHDGWTPRKRRTN